MKMAPDHCNGDVTHTTNERRHGSKTDLPQSDDAGTDHTQREEETNLTHTAGDPVVEDEPTTPGPPVPPDGGWGWVVMLASFMVNLILDGVCFSFGIFYIEFLEYFQASKAKTSWVGSVLNGMYLSMGPIVSALVNKFGCRSVAIVGSLITCLAYILAIFSPNIDVLILTYGALGGMGFGLMYLPAIVMVGFYFEKKRAFATGVAVCGSGIGGFVFAPMCSKLLEAYGWKGATLIISAICLNGVAIGALFRPLKHTRVAKQPDDVTPDKKDDALSNLTIPDITVHCDDKQNGTLLQPRDILRAKLLQSNGVQTGKTSDKTLTLQSMQNLSKPYLSSDDCGLNHRKVHRSLNDIASSPRTEEEEKHIQDLQRPLYRKDIFYSGSVTNLPEYKSTGDHVSFAQSMTSIPEHPTPEKVVPSCWRMCTAMTDTLRQMMDFSLLRNPVFCLYGLSCFLCMTGFFVPFIYLPDHALSQGCSRDQAAFLLSIIGIANTLARVAVGWISDRPWADCLIINNCALILGGVATMLMPSSGLFGVLATTSCIFGMAIAVFVSLRSILMVELIGLEKLTNSFGLVTLCQGLSSFIGAPIAGALFDATGNYNLSFYVAGGCLVMAGVICLPLRRLARWQHNKNNPTPQEAEYSPVTQEVNGHAQSV